MPMLDTPFSPDKTMTYDEAIDFFAEVAKISVVDIVSLLEKEFNIRARYVSATNKFEVETAS